MNISILVFGSDRFFATLPDRSRDHSAFNIEIIANLNQAVARIQNAPPDVIIVQASLDGSMGLCCWLKEQTKLSWIHCILLEDRSHVLAERSHRGYSWESEMVSAALRQGADAYIWWLPEHANSDSLVESTARGNLLLAQLTVGLRKAHKYRDLIRTNDLLSAIALSDALTELNNRRALEWDLPRQINKARTQNSPLSLIILDVDYFKKVNDTYGHLVGDRLLQLLCMRLKKNLRFHETPFRYGGEEFVIILDNTTCKEALVVAKRLNRIVSEQPFAINNTLAIKVTISLGTVCLCDDDDAKGISLLHRADEYLLEAKASGRDRVIGCDAHVSHRSHLRAVSS
ncbi:diguanylate cyclase [Calothrix sp. NIES-4101]|nr:diguanylate cyclase [Calothrix sp. NIES-4101]